MDTDRLVSLLEQKLEEENSEANVYKDNVDNLKWAIKVIAGLVTAFVGFAFASMGVILFKNKKVKYNQ